MKRLITLALVAIALGAVPASANPTVAVEIRDQGAVGGSFYDGTMGSSGQIHFTRTTSIDPSVDPGSLFPVVVDPNDPPEPPATATSETLTVNGNMSVCNYMSYGCSYLGFSDLTGGSLVFDDLPLGGNSMTWTMTGVATGNLGSQPMSITLTAARPAYTVVDPFSGSNQANPWIDGSDVHANGNSFGKMFSRNGYLVTGTITTNFGTFPLSSSFTYFDRYLVVDASADATLPA